MEAELPESRSLELPEARFWDYQKRALLGTPESRSWELPEARSWELPEL